MWLDVSAQSWKRDLAALSLPEPHRRGIVGIVLLIVLALLVTAALVPARAERVSVSAPPAHAQPASPRARC